jgi:DNA-binding GntR family transcriptional regulator
MSACTKACGRLPRIWCCVMSYSSPVREAFRQLAALGLVSFVPNRGVRVRALDQDEWGQAFLARAALEATAAYRAASRITESDLRRIDEANEEFQRQTDLLRSPVLSSEERASLAWIAANDAFQEAILDVAQVPLIGRLIVGLRRVFSGESLWAPGSAADRLYEANVRQHDGPNEDHVTKSQIVCLGTKVLSSNHWAASRGARRTRLVRR